MEETYCCSNLSVPTFSSLDKNQSHKEKYEKKLSQASLKYTVIFLKLKYVDHSILFYCVMYQILILDLLVGLAILNSTMLYITFPLV